jgi:hypothetical protein
LNTSTSPLPLCRSVARYKTLRKQRQLLSEADQKGSIAKVHGRKRSSRVIPYPYIQLTEPVDISYCDYCLAPLQSKAHYGMPRPRSPFVQGHEALTTKTSMHRRAPGNRLQPRPPIHLPALPRARHPLPKPPRHSLQASDIHHMRTRDGSARVPNLRCLQEKNDARGLFPYVVSSPLNVYQETCSNSVSMQTAAEKATTSISASTASCRAGHART